MQRGVLVLLGVNLLGVEGGVTMTVTPARRVSGQVVGVQFGAGQLPSGVDLGLP